MPVPTGGGRLPPGSATPLTSPADDFIGWLKKALGTPYLWGGQNPFGHTPGLPGVGADCAGLVRWAADKAGLSAPEGTWAQWSWVRQFHDASQLKPGDLIFMTFPGEQPPGHVAVWLGHNQVIQDSQPGLPVAIASFDPVNGAATWGAQLNGYGRIPFEGAGTPPPAGAVTTSFLGGVLGLPGDVLHMFDELSGLVSHAAWFFDPANWVRIMAGLFGLVLLIAGLGMMMKAA
jgi:NlpC/P60 family